MKAMLKTAALAVTLGLGAVGSASAATFTFEGGNNYQAEGYTLVSGTSYEVTVNGSVTVFYTLNASDFSFGTSGNFNSGFTGIYKGETTEIDYYVAVIGSGSVTITTSDDQTPVVPLPASLPLLAGALGVAGLASRRRKAK